MCRSVLSGLLALGWENAWSLPLPFKINASIPPFSLLYAWSIHLCIRTAMASSSFSLSWCWHRCLVVFGATGNRGQARRRDTVQILSQVHACVCPTCMRKCMPAVYLHACLSFGTIVVIVIVLIVMIIVMVAVIATTVVAPIGDTGCVVLCMIEHDKPSLHMFQVPCHHGGSLLLSQLEHLVRQRHC